MSAQWTRLFAVVCLIGALPDSQPVYAQAACLGESHSCPVDAAAGGRVCRGNIELRYQEPRVVNTVVRACRVLVDDLPDGIVRIEGSLVLGRAIQTTGDVEVGFEDLSKLSNLTEITGNLIVLNQNGGRGFDIVPNLNALRSLRTIGGNFTVGVPGNTQPGANSGMSSVGDLPALATIGGDFFVGRNVGMSTLGNFPVLRSIGGSFFLLANSPSGEFTSLGNFSALRRVGDFMIDSQMDLSDLGRFANLVEIEEDFRLFSNNGLRTLGDFPVLRTIGRDLSVGSQVPGTGNSALGNLQGLSVLERIGRNVTIRGNPHLSTLDGLSALERIGSDVTIRGNSTLAECCALATAVRAGSGDVTIVENNFRDRGTCSESALRDRSLCPDPGQSPTTPGPLPLAVQVDLAAGGGSDVSRILVNADDSTGVARVTVTPRPSDRVWTFSSDADWLTLTPGSRTNTLSVRVASNPAMTERHAVITISSSGLDDQTIPVYQRGTADQAPSFSGTVPEQNYIPLQAVALTLPEATGGNTPLSYTLSPALPAGLSFDAATRRISGAPTAAAAQTEYTYQVADPDGDADTLRFNLAVTIPLLPDFGDQTIPELIYRESERIDTLYLPLATGGSVPLSYSLTPSLPAGLTFTIDQQLIGRPVGAMARTQYTYMAIDADVPPRTASLTFHVTVGGAPSFGGAAIPPQTYTAGTAITDLTLPAATDGAGTLRYALSGMPAGLSFNAATRVLSGTPDAAQVATTYTYTVSDSATPPATAMLDLVITVNAAPAALSFGGSISAQTYAMGTPITVTLPAAIGGTGPYTYALSGMPSGLSFAVGTRVLSGTPDAMQVATAYTYTVMDSATPSAAMVTLDFTIEVVAPATANIDGNTEVNHLDGLVMYLSLNPVFRSLRSTERFRNELMGHLTTTDVGTTQALVANAETWRSATVAGSDVDGVGGVTLTWTAW